jgi:hypothetical protein
MKVHRIASLFIVPALLLACLATAGRARADASAVALLQQYVNNARNHVYGFGTYGLTVSVVMTHPNLGWSSYVEGQNTVGTVLNFNDGHWVRAGTSFLYVPTNYQGNGDQYFSDRRYSSGGLLAGLFPFNPVAVDSLGIKINADKGSVEWTLNSWGGGKSTSDLQAYNGILLGTSGSASVMISVTENYAPYIH